MSLLRWISSYLDSTLHTWGRGELDSLNEKKMVLYRKHVMSRLSNNARWPGKRTSIIQISKCAKLQSTPYKTYIVLPKLRIKNEKWILLFTLSFVKWIIVTMMNKKNSLFHGIKEWVGSQLANNYLCFDFLNSPVRWRRALAFSLRLSWALTYSFWASLYSSKHCFINVAFSKNLREQIVNMLKEYLRKVTPNCFL